MKINRKSKAIALCFILIIVFFLSLTPVEGREIDIKKAIIGKWLSESETSGIEVKETIEFFEDGTFLEESLSPEVQITSSLRILEPPPYKVGQTITAEFSIRNAGTAPITFDILTVGGRLNDECPQDKCPDFEWKMDITLKPGESYLYRGKLTLEYPGNYHFFTAYRTKDGWNKAIPEAPGVSNTLDIHVELPNNFSGSSQTLKLKSSWSSQNAKELIILIKCKNITQKGDKIKADVELWNNTLTWAYVEQDFTVRKKGQIPIQTDGVYLLGPLYTKDLGTIEFSKGSFLHFNAKTAKGVGHLVGRPENTMLLGALMVDLALRGFFKEELLPNTFDRFHESLLKSGIRFIDPLFYTITSHCSGHLGVFGRAITMNNTEDAIEALGEFLVCTTKSDIIKKLKEWLKKRSSEKIAEKWAKKFISMKDFLNLPMRATLMAILTKYTLNAPSESWARIEAVEAGSNAYPQITSSLRIFPIKEKYEKYLVGDILTAEFTIKNNGITPITFDVLTVGGRLNGKYPNDKYPDFDWKKNVSLKPGETYFYSGKLKLKYPGNYHFFVTYKTKEGWHQDIPKLPEVTNTIDIKVGEKCDFKVGEKSPYNYKIDYSRAQINGWKNPLGEDSVLETNTKYDFDSEIYCQNYPGKRHTGVDIHAKEKSDVYPIGTGKVAEVVRSEDPWECVVIIQHNYFDNEGKERSFFAVYGHVYAEPDVKKDVDVTDLTIPIGKIVQAGSPSHLHFGINKSSRIEDFKNSGKDLGWGRTPEEIDPRDLNWVDPFVFLSSIKPAWKVYRLGAISYSVPADWKVYFDGANDLVQYTGNGHGRIIATEKTPGCSRVHYTNKGHTTFMINVTDSISEFETGKGRIIHYDGYEGKIIEDPTKDSHGSITISHLGRFIGSFKIKVAGFPVTVCILQLTEKDGLQPFGEALNYSFALIKDGKYYSFLLISTDPEYQKTIFEQLVSRITFFSPNRD